jgi:hypothetical protein
MNKLISFVFILLSPLILFAQQIEVQADYNSVGDCQFSAYNNSGAPLYLHLNFGDLQNTSFPGTLPHIQKLEPGFNQLFTLERDLTADVPRFHYEIKSFRSNPVPDIDLDFPYLLPFEPGSSVQPIQVENIDGFWGSEGLESWSATGFRAKPGENVCAIRTGTVIEIAGNQRAGSAENWYNTWTNAVTVMQPDGTLLCYHNVAVDKDRLKVGEKIYAGEILGKIVSASQELVLLIYYDSLYSNSKIFIIPKFYTKIGELQILHSAAQYIADHPAEVRALEMTKKEQRKVLGKSKR